MKEENKPFNDAIDHMNKVQGNASNFNKEDLNKLPKPLKYFGYFIAGFFGIGIVLMLILSILM